LTIAYGVAAGPAVPTANYAALGGLTLPGGIYSSGGATLGLTGTLTLDGQNDPSSVWIFRATSDLVTASSSYVSFVNGASPCNVFWQVSTSATLGSGSTFAGTIMADQSITIANGVTVYGRALARIALVSLINDRFLTSVCTGPTAPASALPPCEFMVNLPNAPCAGTRPTAATPVSATQTPTSATQTPTIAPTAAAIATATPPGGPSATPGAAATPAPSAAAVAGVRTLPSTSTDGSSGPLLLLGIALAGIAMLVLRRQSRT
jgi:type VI secretion system secreted protein VgrG